MRSLHAEWTLEDERDFFMHELPLCENRFYAVFKGFCAENGKKEAVIVLFRILARDGER